MGYIESALRKDPDIGIGQACQYVLVGLLGAGLMCIAGTVGLYSILSGQAKIDSFASLLENLFAASLVIFWGGTSALVVVVGIFTLFQRRNWFKKATTSQAIIVDRTRVRSEDQDGVVTDRGCQFVLKTDHLLRSDFSMQLVRMTVNRRIYEKHVMGDIVRVYYSSTDPLQFLIEGE